MLCQDHKINVLHNVLRNTAQNILNTFFRTSELACRSSMLRGCLYAAPGVQTVATVRRGVTTLAEASGPLKTNEVSGDAGQSHNIKIDNRSF